MSQIVKVVDLFQTSSVTRANSTYATPSFDFPYLFTSGDWDPAPTVYFEAVMSASAGTASIELRNLTDGSTPSGAEVTTTSTTPVRVRSAAITLTTAKQYGTRLKSTGASDTCTLYSARIIFIQNGTIVKTETVFSLGSGGTTTGTTYADDASKTYYYHETGFLDGTLAAYFEGFLSPSNAASTASAQLADSGGSALSGSEITLTGTTTNTLVRSSAITLVDATTYKAQIKTDTNTCRLRAGRIIILQTNTPTKTRSFYQFSVANEGTTSLDTNKILLWDDDEWSVNSLSVYHETVLANGGAGTATTDLNDGSSDIDSLSNATNTKTRVRSSALSLTDDSQFRSQYRDTSGNGIFYGSWLIVDADFGGTSTTRGLVAWAELEAPFKATRGLISFAELESPFKATRGLISYAELEAPLKGTKGQISYAELEVPTVGVESTRGLVSFSEFEIPLVGSRGLISFSEFEIPLVGTRGRISWSEFEVPLKGTRGQVSFTELEIPALSARGLISWSEFQIPDVSVVSPFWCSLTSMSSMTGGGDIEELED